MRVPLLIVIALAMLFVAGSAFGQIVDSDDKSAISDICAGTMDPDQCMFGDGGSAGGGGSISGGCAYCYKNESSPYANCFTGVPGLLFSRYANCEGSRICYYVAPGIYYCQPICLGVSCVMV